MSTTARQLRRPTTRQPRWRAWLALFCVFMAAGAASAAPPEVDVTQVTIEKPADGAVLTSPKVRVEGRGPDGAKVTLHLDGHGTGAGVKCSNGQFRLPATTMSPGEHLIKIAAAHPEGTESAADATVHVSGPAQKLALDGPDEAASDPQSPTTYTIRGLEEWGKAATDGALITVAARGAAIEAVDMDPTAPATQVRLKDGTATFNVKGAGLESEATLYAILGEVRAEKKIRFVAQAAPSMEILSTAATAGPAITIERPANGTKTHLKHLTIAGAAPDKTQVTLTINGQVRGIGMSGLEGAGRYAFVNVEVKRGPQTIVVAATQADGAEVSAVSEIHVQGPPTALAIEGPETAPADAITTTEFTVGMVDAWGVAPPEGYFVTVDVEGAQLESADVDPNTPGVQVRPDRDTGVATVLVRSMKNAGTAVLKATTGELDAIRSVRFYTPEKPFMMVGHFASALGKFSDSALGAPPNARAGLFSENRLGFFARGTVGDRYLLTAAFDSRNSLQDRLFKEMDPDRLHPVFGDTSSVFFEAQSQDQFYLQLEKDGNLYRYGDFNTDLGKGLLGAYDRTLTGIRAQSQFGGGLFTAFGARTSQTVERAEIRGNGTSGYYFLPLSPVVEGSEKVSIEVRDRERPNIVLRVDPRYRFTDYDIDYEQGSLFFKQPVPGIDDNQNPVFITVTYESDAIAAKRNLYGARADVSLGALSLGSTFVREERGGVDYTLRSLDAALELANNTIVSAELAHSSAEVSGTAWGLELQSEPLPPLSLRASLRETDRDFDNPSSPLYDVGTRRLGLGANYELGPGEFAALEYYDQSGNAATLTTANARYRKEAGRKKTQLELLHQDYGGGATGNSTSTLLAGQLLQELHEGLDLFLQREQNLSGANPLRPDGTTVGLDYQVSPKLKILTREKITDDGQSLASLGFESQLLKSTSLTSTYELNSVNNGGYNQASVGLNTVLPLAKYVTTNVAYEKVQGIGGGTSYNSASVGLEYKPSRPFTASLKGERRSSGGQAQTSLTVAASGEVARDLGVLVRHTKFNDGGAFGALLGAAGSPRARTSFGLAYRPANDRFNVLARYHIRNDALGVGAGQTGLRSDSRLGSLEGIYQPDADTELTLKYGWRESRAWSEGVTTKTTTDLWLGRLARDLNSRWSLSGEYRVLRQHDTGTKDLGYGLELDYILKRNVIVGLGYNFAGEDDADFSDGRRWSKGFYARLGFKFDESLFGVAGPSLAEAASVATGGGEATP